MLVEGKPREVGEIDGIVLVDKLAMRSLWLPNLEKSWEIFCIKGIDLYFPLASLHRYVCG